ncbi:hypothetical protein ZX61_04060 [Vibrio sp. VPAP30]|nr:hypothetical protein ZX61_04060 [Vibrio sp. VPAP30]
MVLELKLKPLIPLFITVTALTACHSSKDNLAPYVFQSQCQEAEEYDFEPLTFTVDSSFEQARVNGVICSGSYTAFEQMTKLYPKVKLLRLMEIPGSVDDETNLRLSKMIHQVGISTYLDDKGIVESGGTDLFLSGVTRKAEKGAKIGVHSWAFEDDDGKVVGGVNLPKSSPEHQPYIEYYQDIGLSKPEEFYWFTMHAASAEGIYYMSPQQLEHFGFNTPSFAF